jgi:hypothetical protein
MGIESGGGGKGENHDVPKPPQHNQSSEGRSHNIDPNTLRVAPEQRRFGSGFKKPESQGIQGADKPIFERPLITEAQRLANERWRAINKKMERYTQEQENRIGDTWFDRTTAWFKSQGFTSQNIGREVQRPETQMEMAAMFEECMELENQGLLTEQTNQQPDTPAEQDTTGDSSSTSSVIVKT